VLQRRHGLVAAALIIAAGIGALLATRSGRGATPNGTRSTSLTSPPITIASPGARRLYAEGMKRYVGGDPRESARLFVAALADDSTCAMCAYYATMAYHNFDDADAARMLQIAVRLADRVSEPERLLIHYRWADATNSLSRSVVAESLVTRYAYWPEAQMAAAEADNVAGHWLAAAAHIRRAIAAQPLPDSAATGACTVCTAELFLASNYQAADSLSAALRVAQGLVRMRPHSRLGWLELSHLLAESGRYDEARAAMDTSTRYASGTDGDVIEHAQIEIRAGNFAVADRLLTSAAQTGNDNSRFAALWFLVISLRAQGRLHEALATAEGSMRRSEPSTTQGIGESELAEAQLRFELGQYRRAAAMFAQDAFPPDSFARSVIGRVARQRTWTLTHAGSALAAAGDTVALSALVDTVKWWGARSGFGRDPLLYHYLQGLMWMARARPDSAVGVFRRAITSETEGFSRLDLQLARALLALGRAREAIPLLEHPLAGTLEAGNFYTTRTELQQTLARAYDAAGEPDSAVVYYRAVLHSWRQADAQFRPEIESARERLAADERLLASRQRRMK
jgi:tetratricopeptide (TPR) repeat protein